MSSIKGDIDTSYQVQQRDLFLSGLAAEIGGQAYFVWNAIKHHADFATGEAWPSIRGLTELTRLSTSTVQKSLKTLEEYHLLRTRRDGYRNVYVARERLAVRVGKRILCTIAIDYVPKGMRERLEELKEALASGDDITTKDVWSHVSIIPGEGFEWDEKDKTLKGRMRADEVPEGSVDGEALPAKPDVPAVRRQLQLLTDEIRTGSPQRRRIRS